MDDGGCCGRRTTAMLMIVVDLISRKVITMCSLSELSITTYVPLSTLFQQIPWNRFLICTRYFFYKGSPKHEIIHRAYRKSHKKLLQFDDDDDNNEEERREKYCK